jgi:hypothetical protein
MQLYPITPATTARATILAYDDDDFDDIYFKKITTKGVTKNFPT